MNHPYKFMLLLFYDCFPLSNEGSLAVFQAIETALDCLKSANTEPYYRRQAWEVIKCFLVAMTSLEDNKHALYQLLAHPK